MRPHTLLLLLLAASAQAGEVRFHHLQLNVTDPETAIRFYTSRFACQRLSTRAVQVAGGALLFNKVKQAPPAAIESAIWHFGWGATDMRQTYAKQLELGTEFDTPITDISDLARSPDFFYAYVKGPNGALIELNTAAHNRFGHLHLLSADPIAAGEWWAKHFGVAWPPRGRTPSREPRMYKGFQVGPSVSFQLDAVNVIIFPVEYLKGPKALVSTRGRVVDHLGLSVENLDATLTRLRNAGVPIISRKKREAMIEGPDHLLLQLVQSSR